MKPDNKKEIIDAARRATENPDEKSFWDAFQARQEIRRDAKTGLVKARELTDGQKTRTV